MPRYAVTTFLNPSQIELVEKIAKKEGISKYKLLRKAVLTYCKACLEDEEDEPEKERENDSGTENRRPKPTTIYY